MKVPALKKTARTSHQPPHGTTAARSGSRLPWRRREMSTPSAPATAAGSSQPLPTANGPASSRCQLGLMPIVSPVSNWNGAETGERPMQVRPVRADADG